ncbi:peroxiredoxin [Natronobacterium gregoryi]|uniref:thioredoxin-dependent peroxiredoxin n=2 Tax=Natronobacterium gregoryi TaxID=44930 RepID=L0AHI9_NATGS|nr:peroxiredoxin [Natronobacterium gregoryi]AFZ72602.1 Peroxiredoxin [Natronobacterium gregoryi SP2]ELY71970.1 alkyl hydroperoxide reductase/ Thiol specific antioxidant/ Mal allergen [Natronobacterium gregoryi SP2]PLK19202.1 peroxiredoxin [Natronobacterium gregoryi SP2]SFJ57433.1 peroxiredoxin Q/BCP [Natronobacterium gregoryi]
MPLEEGTDAPTVSARNQDGETVTLEFEEPTVLYFYPRDDTPGCTIEANQFQRERETYRDAGVEIYGVSTDDVDSHQDFCEQEGLEFDLLADPDEEISDAFDVPRREGRGGLPAAERTTFVLDEGKVKAVSKNVDPDGHARDVLLETVDEGIVSLPE